MLGFTSTNSSGFPKSVSLRLERLTRLHKPASSDVVVLQGTILFDHIGQYEVTGRFTSVGVAYEVHTEHLSSKCSLLL